MVEVNPRAYISPQAERTLPRSTMIKHGKGGLGFPSRTNNRASGKMQGYVPDLCAAPISVVQIVPCSVLNK